MKTEFLKGLGLDDEIVKKILAENGKDVEAEKAKTADIQIKHDAEKRAREEFERKVSELEKVDAEKMQRTIDDLQEQIRKRTEADEAAEADKALQSRFKGVAGEAKFVNSITEKGIYAEFKEAVSKDENKGKGDKEIYEAITKDRDGIFQNPNNNVDIPPSNPNVPGAKMTLLEAMKYKNAHPEADIKTLI